MIGVAMASGAVTPGCPAAVVPTLVVVPSSNGTAPTKGSTLVPSVRPVYSNGAGAVGAGVGVGVVALVVVGLLV
jgi:hypothetical protein